MFGMYPVDDLLIWWKVAAPDSKLGAFCFIPNKNYLEASPEILKKAPVGKEIGAVLEGFSTSASHPKSPPPSATERP